MFPGGTHYPEGRFQPEPGVNHNWHVWCSTGALQVLKTSDFIEWLQNNPDSAYTINFANGAAARIRPDHPLWIQLAKIATEFQVEVFPLSLGAEYIPWTGDANDLREFDAIKISRRT